MKKLIYLCIITCMLYSCDKNSKLLPPSNSITSPLNDSSLLYGKWNIVKDSFCATIGPDNVTNGSTYIGVSTDYYNFQTNGTVYKMQGGVLDTFAYNFVSSNRIHINNHELGIYNIKKLTANTLILTSGSETYSYWPSPAGPIYDSISLKRYTSVPISAKTDTFSLNIAGNCNSGFCGDTCYFQRFGDTLMISGNLTIVCGYSTVIMTEKNDSILINWCPQKGPICDIAVIARFNLKITNAINYSVVKFMDKTYKGF